MFCGFLVPEEVEGELEDSDEMRMLAADFEIGHMLRDSIVPKAVLYYTGEAGDEEDGDVRRSFILMKI
jgi:nucleosome assembly protein 1-like 1